MLKQSQCECDGAAAVSYRHTLTVKSPAAITDGHVDLTDESNWTTEGTIKANFVSKGGREFIHAAQVQAEQTQTIETPSNNFSRSILPKWGLRFGSRKFEIVSVVDVDERRQKVRIEAKETK